MNVYQESVRWIRENYKVEGTEDELAFMREKAKTVHYCQICGISQDPFWHLVAAIFCNQKNEALAEKLPTSTKIYPRMISADGWKHAVNLMVEWHEELKKLKLEGTIK